MSDLHPELEELEALALGESRASVEEHARSCAGCAHELAWLRAEVALVRRRAGSLATPLPPAIWEGVQARVESAKVVALQPARRRSRAWLGAAAAVCAAAGLAVVLGPLRPGVRPSREAARAAGSDALGEVDDAAIEPEVVAALDVAERDYRRAFSVLGAEVERKAGRDPEAASRWAGTMTLARASLGNKGAVAADDVQARLRVLGGYAALVRSLQRAVDLEEAAP